MWRAILSGTILRTALLLIGGQITVGQQATAIKRTDLLKTVLPEMEGKDMNVWVADIPPNSSTGRHLHPTPRLKLMESRRRPSMQARHTRKCRGRSITLEKRVRHSQRRLSVSNTLTRASRSKPMPPERV